MNHEMDSPGDAGHDAGQSPDYKALYESLIADFTAWHTDEAEQYSRHRDQHERVVASTGSRDVVRENPLLAYDRGTLDGKREKLNGLAAFLAVNANVQIARLDD